jgi:hypothetical protein
MKAGGLALFLYLCKAEYFFVANAVTDYLISFPSKS